MVIYSVIDEAIRRGCSDIHLTVGKYPVIREKGTLIRLTTLGYLLQDDIAEFIGCDMPDVKSRYDALVNKESVLGIDCAVTVMERRMRVNIYEGLDGVSMALRILSDKILTPKQLKLPPSVMKFTIMRSGLVLVVGTTGSGKSTTLAALIDHINHTRAENIITLEDPIEYIYNEDKSRIEQREIGDHCASFAAGVKEAMRQDPDIVLVGEMRDLETIHNAITLAETGHLVFGTLHAKSVTDTMDRIVDVFPAGQQDQIRIQLASVLKGVINQKLLKSTNGGRIPLCEVLMIDDTIAGMIKSKKSPNAFRDTLRSSKELGSVHIVDNAVWHIKEGRLSYETVLPYLDEDDIALLKSVAYSAGIRITNNWK